MGMSDDPFQADDAATPLTPDERLDLKLSYVALRRELNEAEALNVLAGVVAVTHVEAGSHDGPICEGLGATHGTQVTLGHIPGVPGRFG